jgi:preprotein translocase subunit SecF
MELIKPGINIDFVGKTKYAVGFSLALILAIVAVLIIKGGLNYGADFTGGVVIQVKFNKPTDAGEIKKGLKGTEIGRPTVQRFGPENANEFLIRTDLVEGDLNKLGQAIHASLDSHYGAGTVEVRRMEIVGPKVGRELREKALFAIFYSLLFMAIYISGRFEMKWTMSGIVAGVLMLVVYLGSIFGLSMAVLTLTAFVVTLVLFWFLNLKYALGAILSLTHDVIITVGAFAITGKEVTLPVVAALLTIVGYSVNDTIVIFDRIRENLRKMRRKDLISIVNVSVNETLSRTIITSGTVLIVVAVMFVMGGGVIHDFMFALLVGFISGIYSTVFIANPILIWQERFAESRGRKGQSKRQV